MEPMPNPIHKLGDRNLYCPHYGECLDHAVDHRWSSWDCSECLHKSTQESVCSVFTVPDPDPLYELPDNIHGEAGYRFD